MTADLLQLAFEIQWLSDVLPSMAAGDPTSYDSTATTIRAMQKQGVAFLDLEISTANDPEFIGLMRTQVQAIESLAERSILATLAMLR